MLLPPTWQEDYTQISASQRVPETEHCLWKHSLETSPFISPLHYPKQRTIYFYPITLNSWRSLNSSLRLGVGRRALVIWIKGCSQGIFSIIKTTSWTASSLGFLLRGRRNDIGLVLYVPNSHCPTSEYKREGETTRDAEKQGSDDRQERLFLIGNAVVPEALTGNSLKKNRRSVCCVKNREHRCSFYLRRNCANTFPVESAQAGSKRRLMTL